jgi:hypothetical protein
MTGKTIQEPRPGDPITASWAASLVRFIRRNAINPIASPGLDVTQTADGTTIRLRNTPNRFVAKTSGGITARSGTTPGTGSVQVYDFDGSALASDGSATVTVYSFSGTAIDASKYCWIEQDPDGTWWITAVEC